MKNPSGKTIQDLMDQFNVTESEVEDLLYFAAILKARKHGIKPMKLFILINNYNKLQAIFN